VLVEFTLVLVWLIFSIKIENKGGVRGNVGVETSLKILDTLDAWVEAFESTIKLCIGGEVDDRTYDEE
jgi:hypothetical protein